MGAGGGGCWVRALPIIGNMNREALLERVAFFRLQVYDLRVVKSVILIFRRAEKG